MFKGDGRLHQATNDHGIGPKKHAKGDQRADPRNPEGYGTGKEAETSYSHSNLEERFKAGFRQNAYDIAEQRKYMPPHPENEIPLTRAYDHPLRSKREFGGGLAGTLKEAENFRESLRGQRKKNLKYAMEADDNSGHTQGSRDYKYYRELHDRKNSSHNPRKGSHEVGESSDRRYSSHKPRKGSHEVGESARLYDRSLSLDTWEGEPYRRQLLSATSEGKPYRRPSSSSSSSDISEGEPPYRRQAPADTSEREPSHRRSSSSSSLDSANDDSSAQFDRLTFDTSSNAD